MIKMKKSIIVLLMVCSFAFALTGCKNQIPEMTEEENALITEYAAGLLLKYHADYEGRIVDTSVPPEEKPIVPETVTEEVAPENLEEEAQPEDTIISSNTIEEDAKPSLSIAQILGVDGFDIKYQAFEVCDNYPADESSAEELFFSMKAGTGNKLLVLKMEITNMASQESALDILSMSDLSCKIIINGSKTQRAYVSMLENDFMAVSRSFAAGESYEAVIITEMPETEAQEITSVGLQLKNEGRETTVNTAE
ncbi:MAG: hypothetical protein IJ429_06045 [Lachnospiraceae bacterium]|nr:hypothetical protein [Lachnospiraceae bacterium]